MKRTPVKSSQIASVGYDSETQTLEIEFANGGNVYRYSNVPPTLHAELMNDGSIGAFFHKHIRSRAKDYPYVKVEATSGEVAKSKK